MFIRQSVLAVISVAVLIVFFLYSGSTANAVTGCFCNIEVKNNVCQFKGSTQITADVTINNLKQYTEYKKLDPLDNSCGFTGLLLWDFAMKDLDQQNIETPQGDILNKDWVVKVDDFLNTCNFLVDNGSVYSGKEKTKFFGEGSSYQIYCNEKVYEPEVDLTPAEEQGPGTVYKGESLNIEGIRAMGNKLNKSSATSFPELLGMIIKTISQIIGSLALAMFIYGGILVMSSAGNAERTKQGTQILIWSALGVIIILSAYTLVSFVFDIF